MKQVFISYARPEQNFAETLFRALVSWEVRPWIDRNAIQPGECWWDDIDKGLRASEVMVGLLSRAALQSMNVLREWNWAISAKRKLVLVRLEKIAGEEMSHRFVGLQWIDYHADELRGFAELRRALESPDARRAGALSSPPSAAFQPAVLPRPKGRPADRNRAQILQRVQTYWIDGVLNQAIHETNRFQIGYGLAPEAVVKHADYTDCVLPAEAHVSRFFQHLGSEVLILGTPGSGKTILMLQLAEALLAAANEDETLPIPMVLNLASWAARRERLEEWIVAEAKLSYQIPRRVIARWLGREKILPLLDGLDEVAAEHRDACVEAINRFHHVYRGMGLAVCSRIADYEALQTRLHLRAAILLQPLSDREVDAVITRPPLAAVRATLAKEPWLAEMTHVPFLLNVMSYAYAGKSESELRVPVSEQNEAGRTAHLLDTYISRRLAEGATPHGLPAPRLRSVLAWLGAGMQAREQTIFHIENLQKDWLSKLRARCSYCLHSRLAFGFSVSAAFWVVGNIALHWVARVLGMSASKASTRGALLFGLVCSSEIVSLFGFVGVCAAVIEWHGSTKIWRWRKRWRTGVATSLAASASLTAVGVVIFATLAVLYPVPPDLGKILQTTPPLALSVGLLCAYIVPFGVTVLAGLCSLAATLLVRRMRVRRNLPVYLVSSSVYWITSGMVFGTGVRVINAQMSQERIFDWNMLYVSTLFGALLGIIKSLEVALASIFSDQIESADRVQWRWNWMATLGCTIFVYLACLGLGCLGHAMSKTEMTLGRDAVSLLSPALIIGVFGGLVLGFRREEKLAYRTTPNQGVFRSARTALTLTGVFGLVAFAVTFGALMGMVPASSNMLVHDKLWVAGVVAAFLASIGAMIGGADVPVKHAVLRALLAWSEKMPWRFQRFLDQAVDRVLLRRVGGGYMFIHRSLREHCAKIHAEQNPAPPDARERWSGETSGPPTQR